MSTDARTRRVVNLEFIKAALAQIEALNALDLAEVELRDAGQAVAISADCLEECLMVGLTNADIVRDRVWERYAGSAREALT